MITKQQIKYINRLKQKKYRLKEGLFLVEGIKSIKEFLKSHYQLEHLFTTVDLFSTDSNLYDIVKQHELAQISSFKTPQTALAVFKILNKPLKYPKKLALALSDIRDPGNLGTIIRLCDWFGIKNIYCSKDSVDCYNPKVVQASMGSLSRIHVYYTDLNQFLITQELPIFAATMDGSSVYEHELPKNAIIVLGNEAKGIHPEILKHSQRKISIPRFSSNDQTESLNMAMAGGILMSEFRRGLIIEK
ncbi:MAG: RNA methyltransferase [Psychroflexus sp.]|jgi:TrmH family RNA methyltransferase|nr:RNA methyltransferase [Psychroflexus sp.]MDR9447741.1 RNA methyltransferase [Psychroflexus sp.]